MGLPGKIGMAGYPLRYAEAQRILAFTAGTGVQL
jgi:hypothetical protein